MGPERVHPGYLSIVARERKRRRDGGRAAAGAIALSLCLSGCQQRLSEAPGPSPSPSPISSPTPAPEPGVRGSVEGVSLTLYDTKGRRIAEVRARSGGLNPAGGNRVATASGGTATLYQNGKATTTLTAERISADQKSRVLQAEGRVVASAIGESGSPTVHADRIVWEHDRDRIIGTGNVQVTMEPDWNIPAESFTANTRLQSVKLESDGRPATGKF